MISTFLIYALFGMMLFIVMLLAISRHLFVSVMLFGFFSLLSATLFVLMDAPDVAFTEAAVGAGLSTILLLTVLSKKNERLISKPRMPRVFLITVSMLALTVLLIYSTQDMPAFAHPLAPANLHVAGDYLSRTRADIGIDNVVTAVLASYRSYDTLGELFVIFIAGVGAVAVHAAGRKEEDDHAAD